MNIINPENIKLVPGQSVEALFEPAPEHPGQVGFFVRSLSGIIAPNGGIEIRQRAGIVRFDNVLLVLTMLRVEGHLPELFDIWWNYHSKEGKSHFDRIANQDKITIHFYDEEGIGFSLDQKNSFKKFFESAPSVLDTMPPWTDIEFDRAVRGFCAQSYPKEKLWDLVEARKPIEAPSSLPQSPDNYKGYLPEELKRYYVYIAGEGHCVRVIPSAMERDAILGDPEELLSPAPIRTVLRCGLRWVKGYPIAPIPFIPGHGLAVPPEDREY